MSYKQYFKKQSEDKAEIAESSGEPVVNRFSDIRRVDERRHEVLDYMLMGYQPEQIAEFLDEDVQNIENDITEIVKMGYEVRDEDVTEIRDEIMRIYRLAARESYSAFKDSQGKVETKTVKYGEGGDQGNGDRNIEEETVKTELQSGDSRHIKNMIDAAKEMGKVSGAQKHKEVEVKQNIQQNSMNILSPDRSQMPDDFDRWTKKPEGAEMPDDQEIDFEDL